MSRRPRQPILLALAKLDERKSRLVELRYFGGLTSDEAAEVLGISPRTADREWEMARGLAFSRAVELKRPAFRPQVRSSTFISSKSAHAMTLFGEIPCLPK